MPVHRKPEADAAHPGELSLAGAPLPTSTTVRLRTFLPYQAYRFVRVTLRMVRMIRRSQHH